MILRSCKYILNEDTWLQFSYSFWLNYSYMFSYFEFLSVFSSYKCFILTILCIIALYVYMFYP